MALVGTQNWPSIEEGGFQPSPSVQLVPEAKASLLHAHELLLAAFQLLPYSGFHTGSISVPNTLLVMDELVRATPPGAAATVYPKPEK